MSVRNYRGIAPTVPASAFVAEDAAVIGKVTLGEDVSIWPMTVVRGDVNVITIGNRTNIQDGSVLHVTHDHPDIPGGHGLTIGRNVTVGHRVILHGCTVEDDTLIGMGAVVMDGAVIKSNVLLGAGSLVTPGKVLESGHLWLGSPARKIRPLTQKELDWIAYSAGHYVKLKNDYLGSGDN
jgi:carbonic anhydrase/acetyltransferase-like protein (isoleucine patch superfamily)